MNLLSTREIKNVLSKHHTRPSKVMGQNFLIDRSILHKIIQAANLNANDTVLEIGPGIGTLTQELAKKARKVIAIEKDKVMVEILKETLENFKNIEIIQDNALDFLSLRQVARTFRTAEVPDSGVHFQVSDTSRGVRHLKDERVLPKNYKVVANIPYYLTSPLIRIFLETKNPPNEIILMIQKEVAQRIVASPPNMSILAVSVQFYAKAKIISYVSKECFWPKPNVDSAIIKITPNNTAPVVNVETFFKVVKAGFVQPRKQLANNLAKTLKKDKQLVGAWLLKNNINPLQRAQTLAIDDWVNLSNSL